MRRVDGGPSLGGDPGRFSGGILCFTGFRCAWSIRFFNGAPFPAGVAEAPAAPRPPNRVVGILLLLSTVLGTLAFLSMGTWDLFAEERIRGFGWFSLGILWFLFFSWALRAVLRPKPTG